MSGVFSTLPDILKCKLLPGRRLNRSRSMMKMMAVSEFEISVDVRVLRQVTGEERPGVGHHLPYCQAVVQVTASTRHLFPSKLET